MLEGARRLFPLEDGEEDGGKAVRRVFIGFWAVGAGEEIAERFGVRHWVGVVVKGHSDGCIRAAGRSIAAQMLFVGQVWALKGRWWVVLLIYPLLALSLVLGKVEGGSVHYR